MPYTTVNRLTHKGVGIYVYLYIYYAFATRQCQVVNKGVLFRAIRPLRSFVRSDIVTAISHERLENNFDKTDREYSLYLVGCMAQW